MIPAALIAFLTTALGAIRWNILLRPHQIHLSWIRVIELSLVGAFFNIALPGAVTGDIVKAYYVGKEGKNIRANGFGSILFDRIVGVSALAIVSAVALLLEWNRFQETVLLKSILVFVMTAASGVVGFYLYLFGFSDENDPILKVLNEAALKSETIGSIARTFQGIKHYRKHFRVVAITLAISIVIHILVCFCAVLYLKALGAGDAVSPAVFVVTPLGLLVTAIPVMPAGVGTGHAAFLWLYKFLGTDRGADVFTLIAFFTIITGMMGGLVYLRFRATEPGLVQAEARAGANGS
jgi:uncharacterized protein (TIRG00374 family)